MFVLCCVDVYGLHHAFVSSVTKNVDCVHYTTFLSILTSCCKVVRIFLFQCRDNPGSFVLSINSLTHVLLFFLSVIATATTGSPLILFCQSTRQAMITIQYLLVHTLYSYQTNRAYTSTGSCDRFRKVQTSGIAQGPYCRDDGKDHDVDDDDHDEENAAGSSGAAIVCA